MRSDAVTCPVMSGSLLDSDRTRLARPVTCDRTCPVAVGAYWTPTGRQVQRIRSNARVRPVTATVTSDAHCSRLSCSDRTRPVTLTEASG
jgi:hypothetical protein